MKFLSTLVLYTLKIINRLFGRFYASKQFFHTWQYMYNISLQGIGKTPGIEVSESGEKRAVSDFLNNNRDRELVIFDVGANIGQYSEMLISQLKDRQGLKCSLHLFEPSGENIDILQKKFAQHTPGHVHIKINRLALCDTNTTVNLYADRSGSVLASLYDLRIAYEPFDKEYVEEVPGMTLDTYCKENGISRIDFLKLDVEGAEFTVLKGATELIRNKQIQNIQIEFGTGNITSRVFFFDFWETLSPTYAFYNVLRDGQVEIGKYHPALENFVTCNYLLRLRK